MEEIHRARYAGRAQSFQALSECTTLLALPCVHQPRRSFLNPILFYGGFISDWWLIEPLPSLRGQGIETKSSNPLIPRMAPLVTSPHLLVYPKIRIINITKDTFICSPHFGNPKGYRSSVPEKGTKTKYIFLIINHSITKPLPYTYPLVFVVWLCFKSP